MKKYSREMLKQKFNITGDLIYIDLSIKTLGLFFLSIEAKRSDNNLYSKVRRK